MSTAEEVREKAKEMELAGVNFLDRYNQFCSSHPEDSHLPPVKVEFIFLDGDRLTIPYQDYKDLAGLVFKLRPNPETDS